MASREPRPCGAAFSEWTTSPPPFAASAPLTPCRHEPANRAHSTRDPNDRQQTAYSSLSDADLWGKISAKARSRGNWGSGCRAGREEVADLLEQHLAAWGRGSRRLLAHAPPGQRLDQPK